MGCGGEWKPKLSEKIIGGREKIEETDRKKKCGEGRRREGRRDFRIVRSRRWECRFLIFFKNEEPSVGNAGFENCTETGVGNAGFKIYNLLKPAMGMPASKFIIY